MNIVSPRSGGPALDSRVGAEKKPYLQPSGMTGMGYVE
jgi:hypothetical protein